MTDRHTSRAGVVYSARPAPRPARADLPGPARSTVSARPVGGHAGPVCHRVGHSRTVATARTAGSVHSRNNRMITITPCPRSGSTGRSR